MNSTHYFKYIEEKLNTFAYRIEVRGKINLLELNIHSERFFAHLLNLLYGYNLENLNVIEQNADAIDLIDIENKLIIQVSATKTPCNIELHNTTTNAYKPTLKMSHLNMFKKTAQTKPLSYCQIL